MCDMTHSRVWHDSFTGVTWLIRVEQCYKRLCPQCGCCHVLRGCWCVYLRDWRTVFGVCRMGPGGMMMEDEATLTMIKTPTRRPGNHKIHRERRDKFPNIIFGLTYSSLLREWMVCIRLCCDFSRQMEYSHYIDIHIESSRSSRLNTTICANHMRPRYTMSAAFSFRFPEVWDTWGRVLRPDIMQSIRISYKSCWTPRIHVFFTEREIQGVGISDVFLTEGTSTAGRYCMDVIVVWHESKTVPCIKVASTESMALLVSNMYVYT